MTVTGDATVTDDLTLNSDAAIINMGEHSDVTFTHDGSAGLTIAAAPISIDADGSLDLSSTSGDINFQDGGVDKLSLDLDSTGDIIVKLMVDADDLVFKQFDGTEVFRIKDNSTVTITGDATITNDLTLNSDSAVISMGDGDDATFTHDGTTGLTIAANPISIDATNALDLNSTTGDINLQAAGVNHLAFDLDGDSAGIIVKPMVDADDLIFQQYDGTEVLRLTDNVRVGIGGDPSTILHVKAVDPRIRAEATAGNHPGFELAEDTARKWIIYNQPDSGAGGDADSLIFKGSADTDRFEITATGEVLSTGPLKIKEAAAALTDTAAYGQLWIKTATPNQLYFTTDAGDDIQLTSGGTQLAAGRKTITDVAAALDLSSVATALPYSGAVFSVEQSDATAYAITLPTATSAPEATALVGWHVSVIITTTSIENVTVVRGDTGADSISGIVTSNTLAPEGVTIGSNVITFVAAASAEGDRVDITCVGATLNNTFYTAQGVCSE